jgi:GntR family transcriptional regulator/MocR family aminotransferase
MNQKSKTPLHVQLYLQIKNDIVLNYKVEDKLLSIRKLCQLYNLSKNTVEQAYSQLVAEGYIEAFPRSAYRVSDCNYDSDITFLSENKNKTSEVLDIKQERNYKYDFYPACLSQDAFPLKIWKKLLHKTIDDTVDLGSYPDMQGDLELRKEISKYLKQSRGVLSHENQIVIQSGFSACMNLLAIMLKDTCNNIAVEYPGYKMAENVFSNINYEIKKINIDKNGIILDELKNINTNLVYITPSHQYPSGVTIPIKNRRELLNWAKETNSYIIEDDYDSELNYINKPIPSLQGLDTNETVIYLGTFSKSLSPSLRISYMVLPKSLMQRYRSIQSIYRTGVPLMMQKTLKVFMQEGYWDKHLRKIRTLNKKKHNLMKSIFEDRLGDSLTIISYGAGLCIPIKASVEFDYLKLVNLCDKKSIKIYNVQNDINDEYNSLRMGFGGLNEKELEDALDLFCEVWLECIH